MSIVEEIKEFNKEFVQKGKHVDYISTKYPNKKLAILSCMDTRLTELLPAALNLKNGDAKIIKNAGGVITHPFGSVMRSLLISVYQLEVEDIMVIGHDDCGMQSLNTDMIIQKMLCRNIDRDKIDMMKYYGVDIYNWLKGFDNVEHSVVETVSLIRNHPLIPKDVRIYGFIINPNTGELKAIC